MKINQITGVELCALDAFGVPLYISEGENEMSVFNLACEFCRLHNYNGWREHTHGLYLLRGGIDRSEDLIFGLLEVPELPEALHKITGLLLAYNRSGEGVFAVCHKYGENYRDFVLRSLDNDCAALVETTDNQYISGRGQSHVWIAEQLSGKRAMIIHF